ncbi:MAG TPA: histidine kinase [Opitutaceae bacterium]|jgi:signal transduction histidine kinase|nr:histidine kinase [Opitutaceae bacterium]
MVSDPYILGRQQGGPDKGPPKQPSDPLRILLLEDSETDAELIRRTLRELQVETTISHARDRRSFEAEIAGRTPGIILSDYGLPNFNGGQALLMARQAHPEVPFIFVTGVLGEEVVIEMLHQGATDYVLKNRLSRLVPAVMRALREAEQRRDNQKAQERLRRSHDQLRALTGHLQFVREEERTRISREVHDELGQALTGLKLDLSWLDGKIHGERTLRRKIRAMSDQVDATIQTVRRISTELRPGVLDSLGLSAAIEWQTQDFQERTGIQTDVTIDLKEPIWDREFNTVCFRVFQETLTNIIRHAKADKVEVRLAQSGDELILTVRDNGRGISEKEVVHARSIGLIGMRERVAQVGGEVFFFGLPDRGTTVTMRAPIPQNSHMEAVP